MDVKIHINKGGIIMEKTLVIFNTRKTFSIQFSHGENNKIDGIEVFENDKLLTGCYFSPTKEEIEKGIEFLYEQTRIVVDIVAEIALEKQIPFEQYLLEIKKHNVTDSDLVDLPKWKSYDKQGSPIF